MLTTEQIKTSLRIDDEVDDEVLLRLLNTAKATVVNAIGPDNEFYQQEQIKPLYETAITMLVDHYNRFRGTVTSQSVKEIPYGVNTFILQLKPAYRVFERNKGGVDNGTG